ncbi:MAG: sulfatase-like hydrolase/transferase [Planctomycetota bacterium]|nr:sulfatase-like hydrolase/transferase [Planctomycetota bacterium]
MSDAGKRSCPWIGVVVLSAVAATAIDCVLLQRTHATFTGGFLKPDPLTGWQVPACLLFSLVVDGAIAALFVGPALWLSGRFRGPSRAQRLLLAAAFCLIPVLAFTVIRLDAHRFVGDVAAYKGFSLGIASGVLGTAILLIASTLALLAGIWLVRFLPERITSLLERGARSGRHALAGRALLIAVAFLLFWAPTESIQIQLVRKTSGRWLAAAARWVTDFDGDGYGLVRKPTDWAPFDKSRHPYAVDWPANGIDENRIGGDLDAPGDFSFEHYPQVRFVRKPDVLLIVLESVRADSLEAEVNGKPVAPVLRGLVAEGAITGPAYSHNGFTIESLTHLLTGTLSLKAQDSLIDDFASNGYLTACISGEDESFGSIERVTGMVRAEHFVDARDDIDERTSASTSPGSLTVPWTVVVRNVRDFLATRADNRPIFLYVNFQDCHYPYNHAAMEKIVETDLVTRADIVQKNAARVERTYRNAVANVDRAVGRVLEMWQAARGEAPASVIVADHGESLFEDGLLGHGIRLREDQTRIPFLVTGLSVECIFPLGLADVRSLLRRALTEPEAPARATVDPKKWVFQYVGGMKRPGFLGAASASGGVVYSVRGDAYSTWGEPEPSLGPPFPDVIRLWERIIVHRAGARPPE